MSSRSLFVVCFSVLLGAHFFLILTTRVYPLLDLPNHLAEATLYKYYGAPTNQFDQFYTLRVGIKPNTFHTIFCSMPFFTTVESGNRVLLCAYVLLLPLSVLLVLRRLGGNAWFALPSFLLTYNYSTISGFTGFTLAIPFVLMIFYCLIEVWEKGKARHRALLASLLTLLFFVHALATLFCLLLLVAGHAYRFRPSWWRVITESSVALPSITLLTNWWWFERAQSGPDTAGFVWDYYLAGYFVTFGKRVSGLLLYDNYSLFEGIPGFVIAFVFAASVVLPLGAWKFIGRNTDHRNDVAVRTSAVLVTCSLLCYALLPDNIPGEHHIYERFGVILLLSICIHSGVLYTRKSIRVLCASYFLLCTIHLVLWFQYFREFDRTNANFTSEFFPDQAPRRRLAGLITEYEYRGRPLYNHFSDYYIIWKHGIAVSGVTDLRFGFISRNVPEDTLPGSIDWLGKFSGYDGRFTNIEYLLVRGGLPPDSTGGLSHFRLSRSEGKWGLYER